MTNKGLYILPIIFILCLLQVKAQSFKKYDNENLSVHAGIGTSTYYGDIPHKNLIAGMDDWNFTLGVQYLVLPRLDARADIVFYRISGDDADSDEETYQLRNQNFVAQNYEISLMAAYNIFDVRHDNRFGRAMPINPYLLLGFGLTTSNPKTNSGVVLRETGTTGEYGIFSPVIPFGFGLGFLISHRLNIETEVAWRYTLGNDNFDNISDGVFKADGDETEEGEEIFAATAFDEIRGGSGGDWYILTNFKIEYFIVTRARHHRRHTFRSGR